MYAYCPMTSPLISPKAIECTNSETTFEASPTPQHFKFNKMKRNKAKKVYDACVYTVKVPAHTFKNGSLVLRFDELTNIKVQVNHGHLLRLAKESLVANNGTVSLYKQYKIDLLKSANVYITALPDEGATDVQLQFEYWVDGY